MLIKEPNYVITNEIIFRTTSHLTFRSVLKHSCVSWANLSLRNPGNHDVEVQSHVEHAHQSVPQNSDSYLLHYVKCSVSYFNMLDIQTVRGVVFSQEHYHQEQKTHLLLHFGSKASLYSLSFCNLLLLLLLLLLRCD